MASVRSRTGALTATARTGPSRLTARAPSAGGWPQGSIDRDDLDSVPILVSEDGFPGELSPADAARARRLIRSSDAEAVLVAAGAGAFWWVDAVDQQGVPLDWDLLTFRCPRGDTTVLLARYRTEPPRCPTHDLPLELQDAGR